MLQSGLGLQVREGETGGDHADLFSGDHRAVLLPLDSPGPAKEIEEVSLVRTEREQKRIENLASEFKNEGNFE